ncbi:phage antirepressor KilAC domain-containing protein, partial [Escherichia coli]|nr:phage antirepressor KilAC domain-containing protein [Escherichia coli]
MLEQQLAETAPKVTYYDQILQSDSVINISQIAKDYGLSGKKLNQILKQEGVQYKLGEQWLLYSKYQDKGYTKS